MSTNIKEITTRVSALLSSGNSLDNVARKLNVEFHITTYVNKLGALWGRYKDDSGNMQARVLA